MADVSPHKQEQTGSALLDRIQNNVRDLIAFVKGLSWISNKGYAALDVDVTIGVAPYATLLTVPIFTVPRNSFLVISFSASAVHITVAATIFFRVLVDDVAFKGAYSTYLLVPGALCTSMVLRVPVDRGGHVVKLQWRTDGASARILAQSILEEHANLLVEEYVS
jgi:hypothetical protein